MGELFTMVAMQMDLVISEKGSKQQHDYQGRQRPQHRSVCCRALLVDTSLTQLEPSAQFDLGLSTRPPWMVSSACSYSPSSSL